MYLYMLSKLFLFGDSSDMLPLWFSLTVLVLEGARLMGEALAALLPPLFHTPPLPHQVSCYLCVNSSDFWNTLRTSPLKLFIASARPEENKPSSCQYSPVLTHTHTH